MDERRERELVLDAIQSAFILDKTKGNIIVYVGPHKTSLSGTDEPVVFERESRCFKPCFIEKAVQQFVSATEGSYVVLENPAEREEEAHPKQGSNNLPRLMSGRKINIAGPVLFPLWPTQVATTIEGHHLRSNQYLLVRVYNEDAAKANWGKAVVKPQKTDADAAAPKVDSGHLIERADLTMGKLLIIKGTEVSFYMPPTGIEVIPDEEGNFVRNAVTLERLEYCILLDENGNKRYVQGPMVVFPEPTETFVENKTGSRKFKAIELNEISGLYIKVIAPYAEKDGTKREPGEELFITGKEMMIYYPRAEHAIIKYSDQEIHYAVAIPDGEGRYVLDRISGRVELVKGPCMLLPDPRRQVIVRRLLGDHQVRLWFPGNNEAFEYNRTLRVLSQNANNNYIADSVARAKGPVPPPAASPAGAIAKKELAEGESSKEFFSKDDFVRRQGFTQPRMITLDTKYEGAVLVKVWTGYAVMVVSKTGERKVVVGPQPVLLKYDETLETVTLSTGKPKTSDSLLETVYLRVINNKISDIVEVETRDTCKIDIKLSYRVNFEGDPNLWFNVENYVQFLCDHLRSLMKNAAKHHSIEDFYRRYIEIIRDSILGKSDVAGKERPGRVFAENGMKVYDVEVLGINIKDEDVKNLLFKTQREIIEHDISMEIAAKKLEVTQKVEDCTRREAEAISLTVCRRHELSVTEAEKMLESELARMLISYSTEAKRLENELSNQQVKAKISSEELAVDKARTEQELAFKRAELEQQLSALRAEADALVTKAEAIKPDLIAAIQAFSDRELATKMAESMAPLAILGGKSVSDVVANLLKGTGVDYVIKSLAASGEKKGNKQN